MPALHRPLAWCFVVLFGATAGLAQPAAQSRSSSSGGGAARGIVIDDFEAYARGDLPHRWQFVQKRALVPVTEDVMTENERFVIEAERGNTFVRARVTDDAHRIVLASKAGLDWDLTTHPRLRWDWRAVQLPPGAREDQDQLNDTGAAVYVYFDRDWLGRPRSIKYTYSSTLPVGTEASYGNLRVVVVASAAEQGTGTWVSVERDVKADYERLFGRTPPERPPLLALWSDSDNTGSTAVADFDNITIKR